MSASADDQAGVRLHGSLFSSGPAKCQAPSGRLRYSRDFAMIASKRPPSAGKPSISSRSPPSFATMSFSSARCAPAAFDDGFTRLRSSLEISGLLENRSSAIVDANPFKSAAMYDAGALLLQYHTAV